MSHIGTYIQNGVKKLNNKFGSPRNGSYIHDIEIKVMEDINKNTNEKYEELADRVIGFAMVTGFISLSFTIALAIVIPMSPPMIYSAIAFGMSVGIGKLGCMAFKYYTPTFTYKIVVDKEEDIME